MGCTPSVSSSTVVKPVAHVHHNHPEIIFTIDERLKLKEIWVTAKHNDLKKLGEEIMLKALEKNNSMIKYWNGLDYVEAGNNLDFGEHESCVNVYTLRKAAFKQHGYKMLEKIDQVIMAMVTRINSNDLDDSILKDYFDRIAQPHVQYKIQSDHIDVISECLLESLKSLMYRNQLEWSIQHELAWMKLFALVTILFTPSAPSKTPNALR